MKRNYSGCNYNTFKAKIYFSITKVLKSRKKIAGTNFVLLSRSRDMIGLFMKTFIHKPMKILQFFSRGEIKKCLT